MKGAEDLVKDATSDAEAPTKNDKVETLAKEDDDYDEVDETATEDGKISAVPDCTQESSRLEGKPCLGFSEPPEITGKDLPDQKNHW